jgi:cardiolipin synthase
VVISENRALRCALRLIEDRKRRNCVAEVLTNITFLAVLNVAAILVGIPAVLTTKKGAISSVAWCLVILFLPLLGSLFFWVFGYNYLHRPLRRLRRHRSAFRIKRAVKHRDEGLDPDHTALAKIAFELDDALPTAGNGVVLYHDTCSAYAAILEAVAAARHHIHLEFYIFRADTVGQELLDLLTRKAREGIEVRLLYDSLGAFFLGRGAVRKLKKAGGKVGPFLPLNLFTSRLRVNLRNHRKVVLVDGKVAFTGGMNIGDEYLGRTSLGYWRDQMVRVEGPVVSDLQRVFIEDWDFTTGEDLKGASYYPVQNRVGNVLAQVVASGPDQEINVTREVFFAAISSAKERLWISTPYFIPDPGLQDALYWACFRGVDVRLLMPQKGDHYMTMVASRYYWTDLLQRGVKIYLYRKGMMHSKVMTVDGKVGVIGSANMDPRSMFLNFELSTLFFDTAVTGELDTTFETDLQEAVQLDLKTFAKRSYWQRFQENAFRLFSPIL